MRGDLAAQREREAEEDIVNALLNTERKQGDKIAIKEAQMRSRTEKIKMRTQSTQHKAVFMREEKEKAEEDRLLAYCNKTLTMKNKRKTAEKVRAQQVEHHDKVPHTVRLEEIKIKKQEELKEKERKIKIGIKTRQKQVERNLKYLNEENDRRKEVKSLHKIDQQETLERKQAFEKMGLENRVQMILEKASRVQRPMF